MAARKRSSAKAGVKQWRFWLEDRDEGDAARQRAINVLRNTPLDEHGATAPDSKPLIRRRSDPKYVQQIFRVQNAAGGEPRRVQTMDAYWPIRAGTVGDDATTVELVRLSDVQLRVYMLLCDPPDAPPLFGGTIARIHDVQGPPACLSIFDALRAELAGRPYKPSNGSVLAGPPDVLSNGSVDDWDQPGAPMDAMGFALLATVGLKSIGLDAYLMRLDKGGGDPIVGVSNTPKAALLVGGENRERVYIDPVGVARK